MQEILHNPVLGRVCDRYQWRIQDFPRGGRQLPKMLLFFNFLPKTAWKWKNLDPQGGGARPWRPPLDPPMAMVTAVDHVQPNRRAAQSWSTLVQCSSAWRRTDKTWRLCFHPAPSGGDERAYNPPVSCGCTIYTEQCWRHYSAPVGGAFVLWRHYNGALCSIAALFGWSPQVGCWRSTEPRTDHPAVPLHATRRNVSMVNIAYSAIIRNYRKTRLSN